MTKWLSAILLLVPFNLFAQSSERIPVIFDTRIGSGIDDALALGLILGSPELNLIGVTTVGGDTNQRALILSRYLTFTGRRSVPIAIGAEPQPKLELDAQSRFAYHPDVIFNRSIKPVKESAAEFMASRLKSTKGVTIIATGPMTNIARLLKDFPDSKSQIARIILSDAMLALDEPAAKTVFDSGVQLVVVPSSMVEGMKLDRVQLRKVFATETALSWQMRSLYEHWDGADAPITSALLVALAFKDDVAKAAKMANVLQIQRVDQNAFRKWYTERMADLLPPSKRPTPMVERRGFPTRIHVAEDFETDIERKWWMSGKPEKFTGLESSKRACRGMLTHDFDDLLGNPKAMHTAVIFNPVPGPPMGSRTRLSFRYLIKGSDTLRVQIYSLTNGYHRHLVVKDLKQGEWREATVEMIAARRPDGTGGELSENERIDDIQFYTDPTAELLIDDFFLYDDTPMDRSRPFPKRVLYTGLFDTGKQGKEWPGDFEIVAHGEADQWKYAKSIVKDGKPELRLYLRGERAVRETVKVKFRYYVTGTEGMTVVLGNGTKKKTHRAELKELKMGEWSIGEVEFDRKKFVEGETVDELRFELPNGAELRIDDVLVYEAGE